MGRRVPQPARPDGKLSVTKSEPYWQSGWLAQHDRTMQSLATIPERIPLVLSDALH